MNLRHLRTVVVVFYSILVMTTILPGFDRISNAVLIPYFLVVPGYTLCLLLRQGEHLADLAFYSLLWSLTIVGAVFSLDSLLGNLGPFALNPLVPTVTIAVGSFDHYHR